MGLESPIDSSKKCCPSHDVNVSYAVLLSFIFLLRKEDVLHFFYD